MDNITKKFTQPGKTKQVAATILAPELAGLRFVLNFVSQDGKFDQELDKLLTKKWANVRTQMKEWHATQQDFKLGKLRSTAVMSDVWVVEALVRDKQGKLSLDALQMAVKELATLARWEKASIHVSDLLVKEAPVLKDLLEKHLISDGINVFYYTEPQK